jgi:NADH:ubiquinone oxidoreductase subunit 6 (subunit J)
MFSTNFLFFVFIFMTMQVSTYLLSYVQTLRNIISFAFLALCISFGLGLTYGVQYYPLFILLTYVGAIIVSTLYVVLTFDIRNEYKQKVSHVDNFWSIIGVTNIIDGVFCLS